MARSSAIAERQYFPIFFMVQRNNTMAPKIKKETPEIRLKHFYLTSSKNDDFLILVD